MSSSNEIQLILKDINEMYDFLKNEEESKYKLIQFNKISIKKRINLMM